MGCKVACACDACMSTQHRSCALQHFAVKAHRCSYLASLGHIPKPVYVEGVAAAAAAGDVAAAHSY